MLVLILQNKFSLNLLKFTKRYYQKFFFTKKIRSIKMRVLELSELILFSIFSVGLSTEPIGTGGPAVVVEGGDALLTCVVMNPYTNDTVIWRKGPNEVISAGKNRVTSDRRITILHDETKKEEIIVRGRGIRSSHQECEIK